MDTTVFKINIVEIVYNEITNKQIKQALMFVIKQLMINDKYFHTHLSKVQVITDIIHIILNGISLYKFNANINEVVFDYIKLYSDNHTLLTNNKHKLLFYILTQMLCTCITKYFKIIPHSYIEIANFICKCLYMLKSNFYYTNIIDLLFNVITIPNNANAVSCGNIVKLLFVFTYIGIKYGSFISQYKHENNNNNLLANVKTIPTIPKNYYNNVKYNKCPICKSDIISPIALRCCGFVLCEKCVCSRYNNSNMKSFKCLICENIITNKYLIKIYN